VPGFCRARSSSAGRLWSGELAGTTATSGTVAACTTAVWSLRMSKGGGFISGGTTAEALIVVISMV